MKHLSELDIAAWKIKLRNRRYEEGDSEEDPIDQCEFGRNTVISLGFQSSRFIPRQ